MATLQLPPCDVRNPIFFQAHSEGMYLDLNTDWQRMQVCLARGRIPWA